MKSTTSESYRKRLINVVDYMHAHISEPLDVNTLADIACMSPYHFHRIYRQMAQETVNATVRRMRLQAAASDLIRTDLSLTAIARKMAYSSHEAFSRAFHKEFGETPGDYRENKHLSSTQWEPYVAMLPGSGLTMDKEQNMMNTAEKDLFSVEITELSEIDLIGMNHIGDYQNIGAVFEKVGQFAFSKQLMDENMKSFGIYYDDPKSVDTEELRSMACVTLNGKTVDVTDDIEHIKIPAGKYATLLFKGSYAELEKPYDWFFGVWLPESGLELGDFPPFEEYVNDPKTTAPSDLLTRIHCLIA